MNIIERNTIAYSRSYGVFVAVDYASVHWGELRANSIFNNTIINESVIPFIYYLDRVNREFVEVLKGNIYLGTRADNGFVIHRQGALGDIAEKYASHSYKLEAYINKNRQDPRWIFYTAQSWHDAASIKDNREENDERLRRSMKYYRERVSRTDGYAEEIFYAQYRIGTIMRILDEPWHLTHMELLKAYQIDPLRGESIKVIIDHYLQMGEWNMAYLYSKFAKTTFHGKNPYPTRLLFVDEATYVWKFAEAHAAASFYTGRMDEAKQTYQEIVNLTKTHPQFFSPDDLNKINMNGQFFLK